MTQSPAEKTSSGPGGKTAAQLARLLADTYTLYLKTHNYHWNVTGPQFQTLHQLFETQYTELWQAVDEIAERIRALGRIAPGSYASFAALTKIREDNALPSTQAMIANLLEGHRTLAQTARDVIASAQSDHPTADLATQRAAISEKNAWMLASLLEA